MESADLATRTKTTIPPGPPLAQRGEDARRRQATNKELLNLWRRKRPEVSWRREEGKKREGAFRGKKIKGWGRANSQSQGQVP